MTTRIKHHLEISGILQAQDITIWLEHSLTEIYFPPEEEICKEVAERMATYKQLKGGVVFLEVTSMLFTIIPNIIFLNFL